MSYHCLNCGRDEAIVPLVSLRYAGEQAWICSQCLPILIHQPQRLIGRLTRPASWDPSPASRSTPTSERRPARPATGRRA